MEQLKNTKCQKAPKYSSRYLQTDNRYFNEKSENVHFHISAGNKLAEKYNLWMLGKPSVEVEISHSHFTTAYIRADLTINNISFCFGSHLFLMILIMIGSLDII